MKMGMNPCAGAATLVNYPSDDFLQGAERFMLSRYCNFLLQSILILARVFQVPQILKNAYGEGMMTSARCALFFARSQDMRNADALNIRNLQRHMYCRMLNEAESRENIDNILQNEWNEDRLSSIALRVDAWLADHLMDNIGTGRYPMTNLEYDVEKQWDHVWQDLPMSSAVWQL